MSFDDDLSAPFERDFSDVHVVLNGNLHTLRFTALDAHVWANAIDAAPLRDGVAFDMRYGYDIRALTLTTAPLSGARVNGDELEQLTTEQWDSLFARIDGHAFSRIGDVLWALNEKLPAEAVEAAKKALAATPATSALQSNSASPRSGSGGGSRKKSAPSSTTMPADSPAA